MNGAESLVHTLLKSGVDTCFCQPRHLGDALRRGTRPRARHALRARPVRGRGDRRRRRLRAHGRQAGGDAAALRPGPRQRPRQPAQRAPRRDADRQHRRRPGDLPPPARRAADRRHRGLGARRLRLGAHRHDVARPWAPMPPWRCRPRRSHPGQIATLILPSDTSWDEGGVVAEALPRAADAAAPTRPDAQRRRHPAPRRPTLIVLSAARRCARRGAGATPIASPPPPAARLIAQGANARISRGRGRVPVDRVPVRGRCRGEGAGRHAARHPVRAAQAGDVLRLSEQADDADPGGRRHPRRWRGPNRTRPRRWRAWPTSCARRRSPRPTRRRGRSRRAAR